MEMTSGEESAFLDHYGGQTTTELLALSSEYRIDSLILAFEEALRSKPEAALSKPERYVLAVEAMEREVNNGGWDQFFLNTANEFDAILSVALEAIGCPDTALISREALEAYRAGRDLQVFDDRYYSSRESIEDKLFAYIAANADAINLG
jgi:hypothetical protein